MGQNHPFHFTTANWRHLQLPRSTHLNERTEVENEGRDCGHIWDTFGPSQIWLCDMMKVQSSSPSKCEWFPTCLHSVCSQRTPNWSHSFPQTFQPQIPSFHSPGSPSFRPRIRHHRGMWKKGDGPSHPKVQEREDGKGCAWLLFPSCDNPGHFWC